MKPSKSNGYIDDGGNFRLRPGIKALNAREAYAAGLMAGEKRLTRALRMFILGDKIYDHKLSNSLILNWLRSHAMRGKK